MIVTLPQHRVEAAQTECVPVLTGHPASVISLANARAQRERLRPLTAGEVWQALHEGRMFNQYQGQFDLASGKLVSAEALVRLIDHNGNIVYPDRFIDLAECSELIVPLGRGVVSQACDELAQAQQQGLVLDHVAVNLSVGQLTGDPEFADYVERSLRERGLSPDQLTFELTERLALDADNEAAYRLADLVTRGFKILLDDLGQGYASLDCVHQLPLNGFKLDRSLIAGVTTDRKAASIARHLIQIGHELGMTVIAEGIETDTQARWLTDMGCKIGQGFGLEKPCSLDRLVEHYSEPMMQIVKKR
jgi:EAL domain-containing protein (putative c-di-GMP-specific phosphodiesterase class I)